jgi:CRP-like cAMP-binding protein
MTDDLCEALHRPQPAHIAGCQCREMPNVAPAQQLLPRAQMTCISEHPLFADLGSAALDRLEKSALRRDFRAGEILVRAGDAARISVLQQGSVHVYHALRDGNELVVKLFDAPAIYGIEEALSGVPHLEDVAARTAGHLLAIEREPFWQAVTSDAGFAGRILVDMAQRFCIAIQNERSLAFGPTTTRLANCLLEHALNDGTESAPLVVPLTQDEMARAVGVSRRTVATDLAMWMEAKILARSMGRYVICDVQALARYAEPEHLGLGHSSGRSLRSLGARLKRER